MREVASKNGSVEKALQVIECFDLKNPSLTLDELSKKSGFSKPTVFRMISSLEKFRYIKRVNQDGQLKFQLGMAFLEKSQIVNSHFDIRELAKQEMLLLRNETGLSVQLAIRDGNEAVYIEQFEALSAFRVFPQVGRRVPLYAAACPRVLLAFIRDEEQKAILDSYTYTPFTPHTKINYDMIFSELEDIREKGYAVSKGELHEGTAAIAVPIFDINNNVMAALSVIGIDREFNNQLESHVARLKDCARNIHEKLH
ncbi:IclR family transcriptional regulator [Sutcliffiella cohnii]|uniref:IclR family transcriptional regulator n=1 Tax=Sutcliffiella cohnii TaxID=33932 RepID=UPI002E23DBAA|nr:IclR family transcriptional regulator [Sutcliffiella cohnii]